MLEELERVYRCAGRSRGPRRIGYRRSGRRTAIPLVSVPREVVLAAWFHDVVYDPSRDDNEERSAALAHKEIRFLGGAVARRVHDLILCTDHRGEPEDIDSQYLQDADMAVFGRSRGGFLRYERGIRREYGFLSNEAYRGRRITFLKKLLAKPSLYRTRPFYRRYEKRGRRNIRALIADLESPNAE
jgi:predicted metal-dependent HD superfamily phosphohydrolase